MGEPHLEPVDDLRERERRQDALDSLHHVRLATLLAGGFSVLLTLWVLVDSGEPEVAVGLLDAAAVVALGWAVERRRSRLAAGALLLQAVLVPAARWLESGSPAGLLPYALLFYIYFRGFRAALHLAEPREREQGQTQGR